MGSSGPAPPACSGGSVHLPYQAGSRAAARVFYGPIMCEILPIRERLSTQNIDFKTLSTPRL